MCPGYDHCVMTMSLENMNIVDKEISNDTIDLVVKWYSEQLDEEVRLAATLYEDIYETEKKR